MPWSKIFPELQEPDFFTEGKTGKRILGYSDAVREGLQQALRHDPNVFVMGQGVDDPGGDVRHHPRPARRIRHGNGSLIPPWLKPP